MICFYMHTSYTQTFCRRRTYMEKKQTSWQIILLCRRIILIVYYYLTIEVVCRDGRCILLLL